MKLENIKYKAKRLDNREWVEGSLIRSTAGVKERAYIVDNFSSMRDYSVISVDPSTVCQLIGLKDKNGEEVWEHDLLEFITEREVIIGSTGIFLKRETHLLPLRETTIKDGKLVSWSNHGSKFDRKEGEK